MTILAFVGFESGIVKRVVGKADTASKRVFSLGEWRHSMGSMSFLVCIVVGDFAWVRHIGDRMSDVADAPNTIACVYGSQPSSWVDASVSRGH